MSTVTISNDILTVELDTVGGTLQSIVKDGIEYMWQADPKYWACHDKILFPYVGRLTDNKYIYDGKTYDMTIHGFCTDKEFSVCAKKPTSVILSLEDSDETYAVYPFHFRFEIVYSLSNNVIFKEYKIYNKDDGTMYFGFGHHPAFNVPINGEGSFEDWYIHFSSKSSPVRIGFDQKTYRLNDVNIPFELDEGDKIHLKHGLFDEDAIVLQNIAKTAEIKSDISEHSVKVSYKGVDFVGFWHKPQSDAPYVCIEPWKSLPSHSDFIEDIEKQANIVHLESKGVYSNTIAIEIN